MAEEIVLKAGGSAGRYWRDLWEYRELFWFLAWRDLLVRYKQTVVGIAWAVLRPLLSMVALTIVFGRVAKLPSDGVPYPILVFAALLPWQFFSAALSESGASLLNNANLVSKVYFPRMVIPASAIVTALVDFIISAAILGALMVWYQYLPSARVFYLPLFVLLASATAIGVGLWAAALMVHYRDVRIVIPFVVQFGFFISPVGYSSSLVPEEWRMLYGLNPLVAVIDGFRWCLFSGDQNLGQLAFLISCCTAMTVFISGLLFFRKSERTFAEVI